MIIRIISAFIAALAALIGLTGCAQEIPLTTLDGKTFEVTSAGISTQYAGRVPSEGTEFLLINVEGSENELDTMQSIFFGSDQKAMVTDGTTTAECSLIVYSPHAAGERLDVVLMFQVPTDFAENFTLYGDGFESVALSIERQ